MSSTQMKLFHYVVVQYNHFNITYRYKETIQENNLDVKRTPIIYQDLGKGQDVYKRQAFVRSLP